MKPADLAVTHHFVQLPQLRLHYVEGGTGPLVVLLHGFPESWWSWRHQVPRLEVEQIPNAGHFVHAERPAPVNAALIAFFGQSTAAGAPRSSDPRSSP